MPFLWYNYITAKGEHPDRKKGNKEMTQYKIYATVGTGKWNKGRYEYVGQTPVIPQRNEIIKNLTERGHDVKILTIYPNGTQCISESWAKREAD